MDYKYFAIADQKRYQASMEDLNCVRFGHFLGYLVECPPIRFDMSTDFRSIDRTLSSFQDWDQQPPRGCTVDIFGAFAFYLGAWVSPDCYGNRWYYPFGFLEENGFKDGTPPRLIFGEYFEVSSVFTRYLTKCHWHTNVKQVDLISVDDVCFMGKEILTYAFELQKEIAETKAA